jgi:hypothetical protein
MAEAVGQVWAMAARRAELGIKMDNALLVHAVKLRAIDHRRQLPRGGQPRRDVLHLANFIDGKVVVHRLDGLLDEDGDYTADGDTALQSAWLAATAADPAETLASAVDLRDWVDGLAYEDRELLAARFAGKTLSEIATATDTSRASSPGCGSSGATSQSTPASRPRAAVAAARASGDRTRTHQPRDVAISVAALPLFTMFRRRLREREVAMRLWRRVPLPLLVEIALAVLTVIASQAKRRRPGR